MGAPQADYGIVTALRDELTALRAALGAVEEVELGTNDIRYYHRGRLSCRDGSEVSVVCVCANEMGQQPALNATRDLIAAWKPRHVILVGIAGGFAGRAGSYGDVIVPLRVHYYEPGKLISLSVSPDSAERSRIPRWRTFTISARLSSTVEALALEEAEWLRRVAVPRPDGDERKTPQILRDELASGEEVWASLEGATAQEVLARSDKILAVENEASGFLSAVLEAPQPPDALVIKALSDLIAEKDDRWRAYAASASAAFAVALIEKLGSRWRTSSEGSSLQEKAQERLDQAIGRTEEWAFEAAALLTEEAADLASRAGDQKLEQRARRLAIQRWHEHVYFTCRERNEVEPTIPRIATQLAAVESELSAAELAYEKSRLALVRGDSSLALEWAMKAVRHCEEKTGVQWANYLILVLELHDRLGRTEDAFGLSSDVKAVGEHVQKPEPRLMVEALWLQILQAARRVTFADVREFAEHVRALLTANRDEDFRRLSTVLGSVANRFGESGASAETLLLAELGLDLAEHRQAPATAASISLQVAEMVAERGDEERARLYLGRASAWAEKVRATESKEIGDWPTLQIMSLFARGRVLFRLTRHGVQSARELLQEANEALRQAEHVAIENQAEVRGNIEIFLADVRWWRGQTAEALGHIVEAAELFRQVQSDAAMAHPRFAAEVASPARVAEAGMLCLMGKIDGSLECLEAVLADDRTGRGAREHATELRTMLLERVKPTLDWLISPEACVVAEATMTGSLRQSVAKQLEPLLAWWAAWSEIADEKEPLSEFLDMWGRGGFIRIAAAVRAKPHAAIAVDARSVEEIRRWACVLCPLFDTVIVKWKGDLGGGLVVAPVPFDLDEKDFGLHGYSLCLGDVFERRGREWTVGVAWANPLPSEVGVFLAGEARSLLAAGRLVVLPAPLVGSTQSAVGWTDTLLLEAFLHGVVNVVSGGSTSSGAQRVLDLSRVSVPYIDAIPMEVLASVLNDTDEWLRPLRALLFRSLHGEDLRYEKWQAIAALENDIHEACQELRERLGMVARKRGWKLMEAEGSVTAGENGSNEMGREPVTDLLRVCTEGRRDLAPWIPYWRLQGMGGHLNWTCPLDNPSKPSDQPNVGRDVQTWIWPGTGGWLIPSARRIG